MLKTKIHGRKRGLRKTESLWKLQRRSSLGAWQVIVGVVSCVGIYLMSCFLLFLSFSFYLYLAKCNLLLIVSIVWMKNLLKWFVPCSGKAFTWHPWSGSWLFKIVHEGSNPSCRSKRKGIDTIFNSFSFPFSMWN